jgi:hypothetical protein
MVQRCNGTTAGLDYLEVNVICPLVGLGGNGNKLCVKENNKFKMQNILDRHGPRLIPNYPPPAIFPRHLIFRYFLPLKVLTNEKRGGLKV